MSAHLKQVVISGYYGFDNYGDELILKRISEEVALCGFQPVVLSHHPEQTQQFLCHTQALAVPRMKIGAIWNAVSQASAFISGGGGLFQDKTSWKSPFYYTVLVSIAHRLGKPVAFFGQGLGPLSTWLGRHLTCNALLKSQLIVVRDEHSVALAKTLQNLWGPFKQWCKTPEPQLMADAVWTSQVHNPPGIDVRQGLCLSLRPCDLLATNHGWKDLLNFLMPTLEESLTDKNAPLYLIAAQPEEDIPLLQQFKDYLPPELSERCQVITGVDAINDCLAKAAGVIAMRYHVVLMALLYAAPSFAIAYDPKVVSLARQADIEYWNLVEEESAPNKLILKPVAPERLKANIEAAKAGFTLLKQWLASVSVK